MMEKRIYSVIQSHGGQYTQRKRRKLNHAGTWAHGGDAVWVAYLKSAKKAKGRATRHCKIQGAAAENEHDEWSAAMDKLESILSQWDPANKF